MQYIQQSVAQYFQTKTQKRFCRKSDQMLRLLAENHSGLSRHEIHTYFYNNLQTASLTRKESIRMSMEKVIQRSRKYYRALQLTILYDKKTKKYLLERI